MFGQVLTAMITPFNEQGKVNLQTARKLAKFLVDSGSDGVVLAGTTGESPVLTLEEKIELVDAVCQEIKGEGKVLVGTGSNSTKQTIETTQFFEKNTKIDVLWSLLLIIISQLN